MDTLLPPQHKYEWSLLPFLFKHSMQTFFTLYSHQFDLCCVMLAEDWCRVEAQDNMFRLLHHVQFPSFSFCNAYFHMEILEKHKYFCTTPIFQLSKSFKNDLDIYEVIGFFANNHWHTPLWRRSKILLPAEDFMTMAMMGLIEYQ